MARCYRSLMAQPATSVDGVQPIQLKLEKYHALGNDFLISIMSEGQKERLDSRQIAWTELAEAVCDRKTGIGADGLILAVAPTVRGYEWSATQTDGSPRPNASLSGSASVSMELYNSDGSLANVSGNGMGCLALAVARSQEPWKSNRMHAEALAQTPFAAFPSGTKRGDLVQRLRIAYLDLTIATAAGDRNVRWNNNIRERAVGPKWLRSVSKQTVLEGSARFADSLADANTEELAGDPDPRSWNAAVTMPFVVPGPDIPAELQDKIRRDFGDTNFGTGDVGNPHLVIDAGRDLDPSELARFGPDYASHFPAGINVEFIHIPPSGESVLQMRIWERGAGITEACGTGAVVATWLAMSWGTLDDPDWERLREELIEERSRELDRDIDLSRYPSRAPYSLVRMPGGAARVFFGDSGNILEKPPHRLSYEPLLCLMAHHVGNIEYSILNFLQA